jgi:hypothetical protein
MDMVLGVAVAGALILFSVTLRAGIGATWVNRLGARPWRSDAPGVAAASAIDLTDPAAMSLTTVLRAADIAAAATPAACLPPRRPAPPLRRARRDPRTTRSRAAGPAPALRQPLWPPEHDALYALLESFSIVPAQGETEVEPEAKTAAPAAEPCSMAATIVHLPPREALASTRKAAAALDRHGQADDQSRRAVEEVFAIAAAQLRRRSEEEALGAAARDSSQATREVNRIADELAQHWAVEAVNRAAEQARLDTEARLAASRSGAPPATSSDTRPAGREWRSA